MEDVAREKIYLEIADKHRRIDSDDQPQTVLLVNYGEDGYDMVFACRKEQEEARKTEA